MKRQQAKIFTTATFYKHLLRLTENFGGIVKAMRRDLVDKAFREKIMLAVTQVNGCRYCNYFHTKLSIDAGIEKSEIEALLKGQFGNLNEDEAVGLLFAQHYADTDGDYDPKTYEKFLTYYGEEKAKDILASIKAITIGNINGIAFDALQSRIRFKKMPGSKLHHELANSFGIILLLPLAFLNTLLNRIFPLQARKAMNQ